MLRSMPAGRVGLRRRELTFRNAVSPIGEFGQRTGGLQVADIAGHLRLRSARLDAARPSFGRVRDSSVNAFGTCRVQGEPSE